MYYSRRERAVEEALTCKKVYTLKDLYADLTKYVSDDVEDFTEVEILDDDNNIVETVSNLWRARDREDIKFTLWEVLDEDDVVVIRCSVA